MDKGDLLLNAAGKALKGAHSLIAAYGPQPSMQLPTTCSK